jgi:EAL domain-containing protein (putative c-di-GMP-specific phosphodiesterase class I)/FixJ family two-component response regulator
MIKQSSALKKRILLVDDDRADTKMLRMLLETRGYEVRVALSGGDALATATNSFDLILLDLILPDQEGLEVCRKLRARQESRGIPIIILSGKILSKDIIESLYIGADDYLTKPFEYEELVARMEAVMRRSEVAVSGQFLRQEAAVYSELRGIIAEERITPHFQPIFLMDNLSIYGFEVLSRPDTAGILSNPEVIFKAAIRFGCYQDLELIAWRKALEKAAVWIDDKMLFFNCNPYLVEGPKFLIIKGLFEAMNVEASKIVLEITERSAISNYDIFYEHLCRYRDKGFRFAVDDVGGGYASLEAIVETKPEVVKVDQHIVKDIHCDTYKKSIVKFIVAFCRENNIMSVAEGIENKDDFNAIRTLGVTAGQGYYLCRPAPEPHLKKIEKAARALF